MGGVRQSILRTRAVKKVGVLNNRALKHRETLLLKTPSPLATLRITTAWTKQESSEVLMLTICRRGFAFFVPSFIRVDYPSWGFGLFGVLPPVLISEQLYSYTTLSIC